jgi:hypothetical protein
MKRRNVVATVFLAAVLATGIVFTPRGGFANTTDQIIGTGIVHAVAAKLVALKRVPAKPVPLKPVPAEPLPLRPVPSQPLPAKPIPQLNDGFVRGNC